MTGHRKPPALIWYLIFFIAVILSGIIWMRVALLPVDTQAEPLRFIVKKGQSSSAIAQALKDANLIKSPLAFKYIVARHGLSRQLQAGSFTLSPAMNTQEIALALTEGTNDLWVTFPEGWRREQIAAELAKVYQAQSVAFNTDAFLVATEGKEGYLYPDTYLFPLAASPESIAEHLLTTFDQKVLQTYQADFNQSPYTVNQIITMASLVEREAKTDADRPLVAGILWKRLENDWPLQVDATLQYALGLNPQTQAWTPPTALDKTVDSPYNTYLYPGLPPAPICSPSLDSIRAVLNPIQSPYWFYLTDNQNNTHYAITLDEHNQNINQFLR